MQASDPIIHPAFHSSLLPWRCHRRPSPVRAICKVAPPLLKSFTSQSICVPMCCSCPVPLAQPVAALLGIPKTQIFANRILFDPDTGEYAGFDDTEPTSRAGGKATAIETIKAVRDLLFRIEFLLSLHPHWSCDAAKHIHSWPTMCPLYLLESPRRGTLQPIYLAFFLRCFAIHS